MSKILVFCDESCHTPNDDSDFTAIGSIYCPASKYKLIKERIRKIKGDFNYGYREIKWSKLSLKYVEMYKRLVDFFFESQSIAFSAIVLAKKKKLYSDQKNISLFDNFYYLLYRLLLIRVISSERNEYVVFLDRKDSNGPSKIVKLKEILQEDIGSDSFIESMVEIDSQCNDLIQIADLFCGFITYYHRHLQESTHADRAKKEICNYILKKIGNLKKSFLGSKKFTILKVNGKDD